MSKAGLTPLLHFVVRRALEAIPLILAVVTVNFIIIHVAPGDPATYLAGQYGATPEYLESMKAELGLNKPLYEQFVIYISHVFGGDLGYSFIYRQPVLELIWSRLPFTLLLASTALVLASVAGIWIGVFSARRAHSALDSLSVTVSLIGYSIPSFWLAMMMLLLFSLDLGLFPTGGWKNLSIGGAPNPLLDLADIAWHLILPVLALSLQYLVLVARITRAGLLEELSEDYVLTALCKGLDRKAVIYKHALKNSMLPIVTVIGVQFGYIVAGTVVIETVFAWPGIGRLTFDAAMARDYPVLLGVLVVISIAVIIANLVTDLLYGTLDPRIRYR